MANKITAYGWSQLEGYIAACGALEGPAKKWSETRSDINTWDVLRTSIGEEFRARTSPAQIYEKMASRTRKKDESPIDYFQEMKALGLQAVIEERDVMRYIIKGVTDDESTKVMLCSARTYEELRERLDFMGSSLKAPRSYKTVFNNNRRNFSSERGEESEYHQGSNWRGGD